MIAGIRFRLSLFATLITLLVVTAITTHSLYFGRLDKMDVHLSNSLSIHKVLAKGIANNLYFLDIKTIRNQLKYVLFNPLVDCVLVTDRNGEVLVPMSREEGISCKPLNDEQVVDNDTGDPRVFVNMGINFIQSPVVMPDGEKVGYLIMGFPLDALEQAILDDLIAFLKLAGLALLVGIFLSALISKRFSRPIKDMVRIADKIGLGQLDARVVADRSDELGFLGLAINRMADNLNRITVSREYLDKIIHSMNEMVIVLNPDMSIRFVNELTKNKLGFKAADLSACSISEFFCDVENDTKPFSQFEAFIQAGSIGCTEKFSNSISGEKIPILFSASVIRQANGKVQAIVCVGLDITERKKAEETIKRANEELLSTNQQLKDTQAQLVQSEKLASIGEVAAGLAHEINQPLGAICLNAEIIDTLLEEGDKALPRARMALQKILNQIDRISKIVKHLRVFSRDDSTLSKEHADINWIIEESFILLLETLKLNGIKLETELADNLPKLSCNYIQLEQVITNLISNAKDAVHEGEKKTIIVRSFTDNYNIYVDVEDFGCGIPDSLIDKIFDPFFTTKEVGKGTGLGMSISYGIAKEHNGSIKIRSKVGEGTCFTLCLPIVSEDIENVPQGIVC